MSWRNSSENGQHWPFRVIKDTLTMDNAREIHARLVATAQRLDLPKAFHRDLTEHDLTALTEAPNGQLLLWGIGECGTHMIRLKSYESPKWAIQGIHNVEHWFLIRNGQLEEVTAQ
jgi:hypothetical protein